MCKKDTTKTSTVGYGEVVIKMQKTVIIISYPSRMFFLFKQFIDFTDFIAGLHKQST